MSIFSGITSSDEIVQRSAVQEESVQKTGMFMLVATSVPGIVLLQGSGQFFKRCCAFTVNSKSVITHLSRAIPHRHTHTHTLLSLTFSLLEVWQCPGSIRQTLSCQGKWALLKWKVWSHSGLFGKRQLRKAGESRRSLYLGDGSRAVSLDLLNFSAHSY